MPAYDLQALEGYSYRHRRPTSQQSASALSGCRYLRCKALIVTTLGLLLMVTFFVGSNSAMLIVGLCVIVIGIALLFMDVVARNMGKADPTSGSGGGLNMHWNRVRYRRRRRQRSRRRDRRPSVTASSTDHAHGEVDDSPPDYELSISIQDSMRCPEPSDWTFLPSEPPPVYFPPTTSLDTNRPDTSGDGESSMSGGPMSRVYSISHQMQNPVLPSYEEAISPVEAISPEDTISPRTEIIVTDPDPQLEATEVASGNHSHSRPEVRDNEASGDHSYQRQVVLEEARSQVTSCVSEIATTDPQLEAPGVTSGNHSDSRPEVRDREASGDHSDSRPEVRDDVASSNHSNHRLVVLEARAEATRDNSLSRLDINEETTSL